MLKDIQCTIWPRNENCLTPGDFRQPLSYVVQSNQFHSGLSSVTVLFIIINFLKTNKFGQKFEKLVVLI